MQRIDGMPAPRPRGGIERDAGLQESADVPLDGAHAHLEAVGQLPGGARPGRDRPQLLDEGVQPVGAVHAPSMPHPEPDQIRR